MKTQYEVVEGVRAICTTDGFVLSCSKQLLKYPVLRISIAKLPELFTVDFCYLDLDYLE